MKYKYDDPLDNLVRSFSTNKEKECDKNTPIIDRRTSERSFPTTWVFLLLIIACCLVW